MKEKESIIGKQIGIYQVLYECDYKSNDGHRMFHVKCSKCGWETDIQMHRIKDASVCKHLDRFGNYIDTNFKWKNKRLGNIFKGMKDRCYTESCADYPNWGGKGIKIYQPWLDNPKTFEDWALSNGYKDNLTIDRIDASKNYCPENCQWITLSANVKKKDASHFIEVNGRIGTCRDWSKWTNLGKNAISKFLRKYDEELVKEFIRRRLANPNLTRKSHQTWMNVYGLE